MPTAEVLDHFQHEIDQIISGARVMLLAGADLIQTMSTPDVWSEDDLDGILGGYGTFIIERTGTDLDGALSNLQKWKDNIYVVQQLVQNDVSSTKIGLFLRREMSVRYLIPAPVIEYIGQHGLYLDDGPSLISKKGKSKVTESSCRTSLAIGSSGSNS
jgi:nicotinamide mononucleotide adenylyltransferase